VRVIDGAIDKMVDLLTNVRNIDWVYRDMEGVHHERGCKMRTEREDVLISSQCVIHGQVFDVGRIIEVTTALNIHQIGIILTQTLQTALPG
jgi:hypothetical protein